MVEWHRGGFATNRATQFSFVNDMGKILVIVISFCFSSSLLKGDFTYFSVKLADLQQ